MSEIETEDTKEYVYRVICEWDIGQEYQLFRTEEGAWDWAVQALVDVGIDDEVDILAEDGYICVEALELV